MISFQNKKILIPVIIVLALTVGGLAYKHFHKDEPKPTGFVNLDPPTKEEKQQSEDNKKRIVEEDRKKDDQQTTSDGRKVVTPTITTAEVYDGNVEISGYVSGVFEDGGTCTVTASKDSVQITRQLSGVKNVSYTQCNGFSVPVGQFASGTWQAVLSYSSGTSKGTSTVSTFEVR